MLRPIRNEKEYESSLERIYELIQKKVKPKSLEGDELEVLTLIVKSYEEKKYPIPPPSPLAAIKFKMDQLGLAESDLTNILGNRSRKSEIFSKKRKLSLNMIRKLHSALDIPADILIREF